MCSIYISGVKFDISTILFFLLITILVTVIRAIRIKTIEGSFYFRRQAIIVSLVFVDAIYRYAVNSALLKMVFIIIVVYVLFSILSIFIFSRYGTVSLIRENEDDIIVPNKEENFVISIKTPTWYKFLPLNLGNINMKLKYEVKEHEGECFNINITNEKDIEIKTNFKFKGLFKMGVTQYELIDTLAVFKLKKTLKLEEVLVRPEYGKAENAQYAVAYGYSDMNKQIIKKGSRFQKKEYSSGDNLKYIDWRIYARNKKLYLKDEEINSFVGGRVIFYDNRQMFGGHLHKYIDTKQTEILLSILNTLKFQNEDFNVLHFDSERGIKNTSKKQFNLKEIEEQNSFIPFVKEYNKKHFKDISNIFKNSFRTDELIIISSIFDDNLQRLVIPFVNLFSNIRLIYISTVKGRDKNIIDIDSVARKYSIELYVIELTEDVYQHLKEVLKNE